MIIFTHHTGESHGILGAQIAATFIQRRLSIPAIVVGIGRSFSRENLRRFLEEHYSGAQRVVAFSHLCGRKDLFELIGELKRDGFITLLAGPQARQDYEGEPDAQQYPHRFTGLKSIIDIAFQGPVDRLTREHLTQQGVLIEHPWTKDLIVEVDWSNIYTFSESLTKFEVGLGQVLGAIGCPFAAKHQTVTLPPPAVLQGKEVPEMKIESEGCVFCDVSRDKGFCGPLSQDSLLAQIEALPEAKGKKIPFELINEYPIRSVYNLIEATQRSGIRISQINLVCRVDDITSHASDLEQALSLARDRNIRIMFASVGFESFSDTLLRYFAKGITVADIVTCVETLRRLKERFGNHLLYRRSEGANHGFIHPTPWDDPETTREMNTNIFLYRFYEDILPEHSTPLIIHHASPLGDWIRRIESATDARFRRDGTWIEWWSPPLT